MSRVKTKRFASITIAGLAGGAFDYTTGALLAGAESLTVTNEPGDYTDDDPNGAMEAALNRGSLTGATLFRTDDAAITLGFSAYVSEFTNALAATLLDICNTPGGYVAANWESVTALAAGCDPNLLVDVRYTLAGAAFCDSDQIRICRNVKLVSSFAEGLPNTASISGASFYPEIIRIG